jgi:hypothetical protein
MTTWLLLLGGLVVLAASLWCRAGRSDAAQWWVGSDWNERAILFVLPGGSVFVLGLLSVQWVEGSAGIHGPNDALMFLAGVTALMGVVVMVWGMFFLPIPRWFVPRWFRQELIRRRYEKENIKQQINAERKAKRRAKQDRRGRG